MSTSVHILNHTHWDREWFLTSTYTSQWIPNLIDRIWELKEKNPGYRFLLDGQTLVIKDLLDIAPEYEQKIHDLVAHGNLLIGPYYCQPDWRLANGESLIRNMFFGLRDNRQNGGNKNVGWLVDNFGHISQAPQLHRLFGIESAYVWRGAPELEPYFLWRGTDGSQLFVINLIAGYRNLYGVTHAPEVALQRLTVEVDKLAPFYLTGDVPLFDGYDLEQNPEDAYMYYQGRSSEIPENIELCQTSPIGFAEEVRTRLDKLPVVAGELNSGKYSATFPGTLSSRTYLKVMNHDCERLLYQVCEPLAVLACIKGRKYTAQQYESWGRQLLENEVHDCICGVSIDQVHEKMEISYAGLYNAFRRDVKESLNYILDDFQSGRYAVSTAPFEYEGWHAVDDSVYRIQTHGMGVWPVTAREPISRQNQPIETFHWKNKYYAAEVTVDGVVHVGKAVLGRFTVMEECGDTYSDEAGESWGDVEVNGPLLLEQSSDHYSRVRFDCSMQRGDARISARVRLIFDQTEIIKWQIELDSRGTDFQVNMVFETTQTGKIYAGMPFDVVERPFIDADLLPRHLQGELSEILNGQREIGEVRTFPFQDFVGVTDGISSAIIFARGIRAYQSGENGEILLPLRRSVEWLTKSDLKNRVGDAGPFMYVPGARCERSVRHEIGVAMVGVDMNDLEVQRLNAAFSNPPIIVDSNGRNREESWQLLREDIPFSTMQIIDQKILARFYNPGLKKKRLRKQRWKVDMWGVQKELCEEIGAKEIITFRLDETISSIKKISGEKSISLVDFPEWRVGEDQSHPDNKVIDKLKEKITQTEIKLKGFEEDIKDNDDHRLQHKYYILKRELYELRLSVLLNEKKLNLPKETYQEILFKPDPELVEIGSVLNQYRIMRRIYDYVSTL